MKNKIQGLVLRVNEYKDKDGLVCVLTDHQVCTLYAKGLFKPNSKNLRLVQPFSYNEFLVEDKMKMPLLLQGNTIHYYYHIQEDLLVSSVCFVVHDLIQKMNTGYDMFEILLEVWNSADKRQDDFYFWCCVALKFCIEKEGIAPYVDGCVHCKKQRVVTMSMKDGGFLCETCNHGQYTKWDVMQLKKIRALFKCTMDSLDYVKSHFLFNADDFMFLAKWCEYHTQKRMPSLHFLETIVHM